MFRLTTFVTTIEALIPYLPVVRYMDRRRPMPMLDNARISDVLRANLKLTLELKTWREN